MERLYRNPERNYGDIVVPPRPAENQPVLRPETDQLPYFFEYEFPSCKETLKTDISDLLGENIELDIPPEHVDADLAIRLFKVFSSPGRESVKARLGSAATSLTVDSLVQKLWTEGPYLNIKLNAEKLGNLIVRSIELLGSTYGSFNEGDGTTVVLDTSSPNIAKEMTVAHLRSTVIGESLGRLYQYGGYQVIRDNHLGDWGTQFGILGRAYELWKDDVPELQEGGNPIKGLHELYVRMNQAIEAESQRAEGSDLKQEGLEWFRRLEAGDEAARRLWRWALDISLLEANRVYQRLGSTFEYVLGESQYVSMLPSVINAMERSGLAGRDEVNRVVIDFGDTRLGKLTIQKSDGASLYATRDLATLAARTVWFSPAKILYVVGGEQRLYFKQVFEAFNRYSKVIGQEPPETEHVYFGMVKLPEGKMSTRKGNVIFLEDVMDEAVARARRVVEAHARQSGIEFGEAEVDKIAEGVGIGAVIYSELRQSRGRGIEFNWNEILSFNGNSGPYLQYTNARISAIFRKLGEHEIDFFAPLKLSSEYEERLVLELGRFPETIKEAIDKNEPSLVADYLYRLSSVYNSFYKTSPVLNAPDAITKNTRLRLCGATSIVLRRGMYLLGVPVLERM